MGMYLFPSAFYSAPMPLPNLPIKVAALYHFVALDNVPQRQEALQAFCREANLRGTILLASEGINGTVAGSDVDIDALVTHLRGQAEFAQIDVKFSRAAAMPFLRMKVRIKKEIVTMGVEGIDGAHEKGRYVEPADWNALIADPDTVVIDTRNDYEVAIGSFTGAVDPATKSFREFPAWFDAFAAEKLGQTGKPPKIAMFCTGGIRCEKATAYVRAKGFDQVYHLKGGILRYLETVAAEQSQWQGDCFLFDQRVAVGHGLVPGDYDQCHACRMPLNADDRASPLYEPGIACPHCHDSRDEEQRARYRARQHQMELAAQRGEHHLGDAV